MGRTRWPRVTPSQPRPSEGPVGGGGICVSPQGAVPGAAKGTGTHFLKRKLCLYCFWSFPDSAGSQAEALRASAGRRQGGTSQAAASADGWLLSVFCTEAARSAGPCASGGDTRVCRCEGSDCYVSQLISEMFSVAILKLTKHIIPLVQAC